MSLEIHTNKWFTLTVNVKLAAISYIDFADARESSAKYNKEFPINNLVLVARLRNN